MVRYSVCLLLAGMLVISGCDLFRDRDFITVRDGKLYAGDEPYYFAGTNFWYGPYLASASVAGDRDRLVRELDALQSLGITNLRILAGSEHPYIDGMLTPAIQSGPGEYTEDLLVGLDHLLSEMADRDMRAVLFLTNYWEWSGGMAQYVAWSKKEPRGPHPSDPDFSWANFMDYSAEFYGDSVCQWMFREHVRKVVTRTNTVTGRPYTEDPTIMAWELANEPRPGTVSDRGERNLPAYYRWIDSTARFIKSLDQRHLVTSGSEGIIGSLLSPEVFLRAHSSPAIDYLTVHVWAYNWKWFDPMDVAGTIDSAEIKALGYVQDHFPIARALNKPIVLEEFGMTRDSARIEPSTPVTARDRYFRAVLTMVHDSAAAGGPIAGSNFWAWSGVVSRTGGEGNWKDGDPLMGDPPHEPQGLNSVFLSDSTTINILREHATMMNRLGGRSLAGGR